MAGIIEHFYFNDLIHHSLAHRPRSKVLKNGNVRIGSEFKQLLSYEPFVLTGILPDMAKDRSGSHFRYEARRAPGIFYPDLEVAERKIKQVAADWSIRMGIYSHFWLDTVFLDEFLIPKFDFNTDKITNLETKESFKHEEFKEELKRAYTETGKFLVDNDKIAVEDFMQLSDVLPVTNVSEFDDIDDESWKKRFEKCLTSKLKRKNHLFPVEDYVHYIENKAVTLTALMFYME